MKSAIRISLLLSVLCTTAAVQAQTMGPFRGDAKHGAQLYYDHGCYQCHGYFGYGRKDLNNTGSPFLVSEEIFRTFLRARADVAPLLPSTNMPNFPANTLDDSMVQDLYAYIRSMPSNIPETGSVPTLQAILESGERPYRP
jgi:mono/diheme cytochrome c family protein